MKNFDDYRLELKQYANNLDNKRQDSEHILNKDVDYECYKNMMTLFGHILLNENNAFDAMGDNDLKNYEKWLEDGEF